MRKRIEPAVTGGNILGSGHGNAAWRDEMLLDIYDMAKEGCNDSRIAAVLGVDRRTFLHFYNTIPLVTLAVNRGRSKEKDPVGNSLEFIHDLLPEDVREVWDRVRLLSDSPDAREHLNEVLAGKPACVRQWLYLQALVTCDFSQAAASRMTGVTHKAVKYWRDTDPEFALLFDHVMLQIKKDIGESALIRKVREGDTSAILFFNRTINADRGYAERLKVDKKVDHSHTHRVEFSVADLDLPLEVLDAVYEAMERKQAQSLPAPSQPVQVIEHRP